jgi:hypothetical protein
MNYLTTCCCTPCAFIQEYSQVSDNKGSGYVQVVEVKATKEIQTTEEKITSTQQSHDDDNDDDNDDDEDERDGDDITPPPMNFRAISGAISGGMSTTFVFDKDGQPISTLNGGGGGGFPSKGNMSRGGSGMARAPSMRGGGMGGNGGLQRSQSSWIRKDQVGVSG